MWWLHESVDYVEHHLFLEIHEPEQIVEIFSQNAPSLRTGFVECDEFIDEMEVEYLGLEVFGHFGVHKWGDLEEASAIGIESPHHFHNEYLALDVQQTLLGVLD